MFCFLHLPYHHRSTVHINNPNQTTTAKQNKTRLYQFFATAPDIYEPMSINYSQSVKNDTNMVESKIRRMLFRRSRSEPLSLQNSSMDITSRTDPEWSINIDSISIQSSFVDYQSRRKNRFKKAKDSKSMHSGSVSSDTVDRMVENEEMDMDEEEENKDIDLPSTLDLSTDSDNTNSSNDITSSQAKEVNYENDIKQFMETTLLGTNMFDDPFETEDRRSRTEQWVEAGIQRENEEGMEGEEGTRDGEEKESREEDKEADDQKSTEESMISSSITAISIRKEKYRVNIKEAVEAESEVDLPNIDRFWDYLYEKKPDKKKDDEEYGYIDPINRLNAENEILKLNLTEDMNGEQDREFDEISDEGGVIVSRESSTFFELKKFEEMEIEDSTASVKDSDTLPIPNKHDLGHLELICIMNEDNLQNTSQSVSIVNMNQTDKKLSSDIRSDYGSLTGIANGSIGNANSHNLTHSSSLKNVATSAGSYHHFSSTQSPLNNTSNYIKSPSNYRNDYINHLSIQLIFRDLKQLIIERDRAIEALGIMPARTMNELSEECNYYQARYRVVIEKNKHKLDIRIEEKWREMLKLDIDDPEILAFIRVTDSCDLTMNARRFMK